MYVYADESGHSGKNIFQAPKYFIQGALLTIENGDELLKKVVEKYCNDNGVDRIHAHTMPVDDVIFLYNSLKDVFKDTKWKFHFTKIDKQYLSVGKFVDTFFDSGENHSVDSRWYNQTNLRHTLVFAFSKILTERNRKNFWNSFLNNDKKGLISCISNAQDYFRRYIAQGSDLYAVVHDGLMFAKKNIDDITIDTKDNRHSYKMHTPNGIAFTSVLQEACVFSENNDSPVESIVHDRISEFKRTMEFCHEFFSLGYFREKYANLPPLWEGREGGLGALALPQSGDSPALQVVDLLTWINQRDGDARLASVKEDLGMRSEGFHITPEMTFLLATSVSRDSFFSQFTKKAFS